MERLLEIACTLGLYYDLDTLLQYISEAKVQVQPSGPALQVHDSTRTWDQHYAALSFLVNGNLHADYERLSGFLGFPQCSSTQWHRIVEWLEPVVTEMAEWSCGQVRDRIIERGDQKKWIASFDGFYLTRGHYSNNCSALYMTTPLGV